MNIGRTMLLFSLIMGFAALRAPLVLACAEYAAGRVMERSLIDQQVHQKMFTTNQDLFATGDFDGDDRVDKAFFTKSDGEYSLVVCLDDGRRAIRVEDRRFITGYGIRAAPPGVYVAACAMGYGSPCGPGKIAKLELDHDAIEYIDYERFSGLHYWSNGKFKRFYLTD